MKRYYRLIETLCHALLNAERFINVNQLTERERNFYSEFVYPYIHAARIMLAGDEAIDDYALGREFKRIPLQGEDNGTGKD